MTQEIFCLLNKKKRNLDLIFNKVLEMCIQEITLQYSVIMTHLSLKHAYWFDVHN